MKKVLPLLIVLVTSGMFGCKGSGGTTTSVVRPRYHKAWPKNQYRVDIPVGARHIRFLERKRTQIVKMH